MTVVVSMYTQTKAEPWLRIAEHHLKREQYMTAKRLSSLRRISVTVAGCCLVALGWVKISNKTYEKVNK